MNLPLNKITLLNRVVESTTKPLQLCDMLFFALSDTLLDIAHPGPELDSLFLLGLPLEVTVDVGIDWRDRIGALYGSEAGELASVISIANGWMRYLPHEMNFDEPLAEQKYEILQSTFVPQAATVLLEAAVSLAANLEPAAFEA